MVLKGTDSQKSLSGSLDSVLLNSSVNFHPCFEEGLSSRSISTACSAYLNQRKQSWESYNLWAEHGN